MPESTNWAIYRRLLAYSKPHWRVFLFAVLGMLVFATVDASFIRLIQPLVDGSFVKRDTQIMRMVPFVILGLFVLRGVGYFTYTYGMMYVSQKVVATMRAEVFDHLLALPVAYLILGYFLIPAPG